MHEENMPFEIKISEPVSEPRNLEVAPAGAGEASPCSNEIDAWKRSWLKEVDRVDKRFKRGAGLSQGRRSGEVKKHLKFNTQFVG